MLNVGVASVMKQFPLLSREPNRGFVEKGKSLFGNTSLASIFFSSRKWNSASKIYCIFNALENVLFN